MPRVKKGQELCTLASGIHVFTKDEVLTDDQLKDLGLTYVGRIDADSNIRIGQTPLGEILRSFHDWKDTVKGIEANVLNTVAMHIAFKLKDEEREQVIREWYAADAASRVTMVTDMFEAMNA